MIVKKEVIIKENEAFRLRLKKWNCLAPKDLFAIEMIQESLTKGEVTDTQTYNFNMTEEELATLAKALVV